MTFLMNDLERLQKNVRAPAPPRGPASFYVVGRALRAWYDDWFQQFLFNFLTTLGWATILLGPPMLFAMYEAAHERVRGRGIELYDFFRAARRHARASWKWALINLVIGMVIGVNVLFYWQWAQSWSIFLATLFFFAGLFWAMIQMYVIPYYMAQETRSLKLAHKNAALTFLAAPGYTGLLFFLTLILFLVSLFFILPWILAFPALAVLLGAQAVRDRLQAYGVETSV